MSNVKKVWNYDEVQALIHLVRKNPSLYDRRAPDYNQTRTKDDIWKTISLSSSIVDKNAEECKKKWKTLRIQQRRIIIKKIKKKEKSSAIQWNCYDALKFLIPHMDWTATDENSIKNETELDFSVLSEIGCDGDHDETEESYENDEHCESQSDDSSYTSSHAFQESVTNSSTPITRNDQQCTATPILSADNSKMNQQYLLTYLPTAANNQIPIRTYQDTVMTATNCVSINNQPQQQTQSAIPTIYADPNSINGANTTIDNKFQINNRITTALDYFLLDVGLQMGRLNDVSQLETKIEIHRLLLEKLKNINNLRQPTSICFTTQTNPN